MVIFCMRHYPCTCFMLYVTRLARSSVHLFHNYKIQSINHLNWGWRIEGDGYFIHGSTAFCQYFFLMGRKNKPIKKLKQLNHFYYSALGYLWTKLLIQYHDPILGLLALSIDSYNDDCMHWFGYTSDKLASLPQPN